MQTALMKIAEMAKDIGWWAVLLFLALLPAPLRLLLHTVQFVEEPVEWSYFFPLPLTIYESNYLHVLSLATPAMETKKHTSLVEKLIESAIATLEKGKYFNSIQ